MSNETLGGLMLWVLGIGGGAWSIYQLINAILGKFARKADMDALRADVTEIKSVVQKIRDNAISSEAFRSHEASDEQDRKERRENEISIFAKLDELKDSTNERLDGLKDLIIARVK